VAIFSSAFYRYCCRFVYSRFLSLTDAIRLLFFGLGEESWSGGYILSTLVLYAETVEETCQTLALFWEVSVIQQRYWWRRRSWCARCSSRVYWEFLDVCWEHTLLSTEVRLWQITLWQKWLDKKPCLFVPRKATFQQVFTETHRTVGLQDRLSNQFSTKLWYQN